MKKIKLKTKRLWIEPVTDEELRILAENEQDAHLHQAYCEMLEGCTAHPKQRIWYTYWKICLAKDGETVGSLGFCGAPENAEVEIGYGIDEPYRKQGYATEAVKAAMEWAFTQEGVYFVTAETQPDNIASQRVLEKLGFKKYGEGKEGPRFENEKPVMAYTAVFMCLYLGVGLCFGTALQNVAIGMCIGIALGLSMGAALDAQDKKKREEIRARRKMQNSRNE